MIHPAALQTRDPGRAPLRSVGWLAAAALLFTGCGDGGVGPQLEDRVDPVARPAVVRGIYVNAQVAGDPARVGALIDMVEGTSVNTFVVDVKERGEVSYASSVDLVSDVDANRDYITDLPELLRSLREAEIYPIARIVVFSDRVLASAREELAIQTTAGGVWLDPEGNRPWVDPYNEDVWEYNIALAREAIALGFAEIQWDYVRFPDVSDEVRATLVYPAQAGRSAGEAIEEFIAASRAELAGEGVPVTADVFGRVITVPGESTIGQEWDRLVRVTDVLLPMVYPALYGPGSFGIDDPNAEPYQLVSTAMQRAVDRMASTPSARATIRPWLQAFTLGSTDYGAAEMLAQIQAVEDAGLTEWLFWNPDSVYPDDVF